MASGLFRIETGRKSKPSDQPPLRVKPIKRRRLDYVFNRWSANLSLRQFILIFDEGSHAHYPFDEITLPKQSTLNSARSLQPWLFVGLGNPGDKYRRTRHNVGFEMIDVFAESLGIQTSSIHCKAILGKGFLGDVPIFLAKPQTYMNLSGESAGPLAAYYKLPLNRVIVLHDDMDLPCGVLRLAPKGGHGSHNGLKNVIYHFRGNREFPRLRIGIGKPPGQMDPKAFLLQQFNATSQRRIDAGLEEGVSVLKLLVSRGLVESARSFNTDQKYKHHTA